MLIRSPDHDHSGSGLLHRDPNRTALFSSSRSSSPLPMYNRPSDRYAADRTAEDIEGQNDEGLEGLSQKVKLLKNVRCPPRARQPLPMLAADSKALTSDSQRHRSQSTSATRSATRPRCSTAWCASLALERSRAVPPADVARTRQNDTFGETGNFLSGTMTKMKKMARRQGGQWCLCASPSFARPFASALHSLPSTRRAGMVFLGIVCTVFFWTWLLRRCVSRSFANRLDAVGLTLRSSAPR